MIYLPHKFQGDMRMLGGCGRTWTLPLVTFLLCHFYLQIIYGQFSLHLSSVASLLHGNLSVT